ncbi:hypothetical protein NDK43_03685 [Neobacillus pocheonensis]|uniref:Uncharacterized protein n=1 Tax=Neobacillus pocheonensis TaxID=363869 RepID=A0ABT0W882_9BACI|nr:hypothetical protein [Neobacillus pocheonensis]
MDEIRKSFKGLNKEEACEKSIMKKFITVYVMNQPSKQTIQDTAKEILRQTKTPSK